MAACRIRRASGGWSGHVGIDARRTSVKLWSLASFGIPTPRRSHLGPPAAGHRSRTYCSARSAESGRVCRLPSGAGAYCDADREGSDPSSRGFRPSQRSQASPRPPAPRALGCARPISWRCRRQAMASNVIGAPCSVVFSHRIFRKCGGGFIGSSQSRTAAGLDGQGLRPRLAAARFHAGSGWR